MPAYLPYIFLAVGILSFIPRFRQFVKPIIEKAGKSLSSIPLFAAPVIAGIVFYLFRQKTIFLGDGQLRVRNTEVYYLFSFEEPLDTFIHTLLYKYLNPALGLTGKDIYQYVSILCGMAAVGGMVYIIRKLYEGSGKRWFIGCLILTCGSMQYFFGYVESYTVLGALILMFLLSGQLMLKRMRFTVIPIIFLSFAVITHPLAILFIPGALYAYLQVINSKKNNSSKVMQWTVTSGIFVIIIGGLLTVFGVGGHSPLKFLTHYTGGSNLLPIVSKGDLYGIFSSGHFIDILNEIGLVVPACISVFIILPGLLGMRRSRPSLFHFMCCLGPLLFLVAFNPKLGYARDWDIFGIIAFPATLWLGVLIIENVKKADLLKVALPLLAISFIHTVSWIGVNSSGTASFARFVNLSKTPYLTDYAKSMAHESIASYYFDETDFRKSAEHYELAYDYSNNIRFFMNFIAACGKLNDYELLERFSKKYDNIAEGHFYLGVCYLEQNKLEAAMEEFEKTLILNPEYSEAYFKLGVAYVIMKKYDEGIREYKKALSLTQNKELLLLIYNNLGNAYIKNNMASEAITQLLEAIKIKPDMALAHFNLAHSYYVLGEYELSGKHVDLALRYGHPAQELRELIRALSSKE
ncbi:tetratricopeptide repeat protein [Candidatus Latescibacterota bacterium]